MRPGSLFSRSKPARGGYCSRAATTGETSAPLVYDITPNGQRFVIAQEPEEAAPEHRQIVYIPDFFDELKAKMAEAGQ